MVIDTSVKAPPLCIVEGWAALASIPSLVDAPAVMKIGLPRYAKHHPPIHSRSVSQTNGTAKRATVNGGPAIDGNGVTIMNAGVYNQQTGVNGSGINLAVISDDVTSLSVIQGRGELPAGVNVVLPSVNPTQHLGFTDEGTMMLEEAYAVAPGAGLAFCGPETYAEYLLCITNLIDAGATVVSDDITYNGSMSCQRPRKTQKAWHWQIYSVGSQTSWCSMPSVTRPRYTGKVTTRPYRPLRVVMAKRTTIFSNLAVRPITSPGNQREETTFFWRRISRLVKQQ